MVLGVINNTVPAVFHDNKCELVSSVVQKHQESRKKCCPNISIPSYCSCPDSWTWNCEDRSSEAHISLDGGSSTIAEIQQTYQGQCASPLRTVVFHPNWSNGTAAVRGTKPLDAFSLHYWEIHVARRLFGTSLQFGVATKSARLHVDAFINLLGEDEHSWALSHKGSLWHDGRCQQFVEPFDENESVTVGLLFDGPRGTLTYFKDGVCLGVAFSGLVTCPVGPPLYPIISSTAAKTEMTLVRTLRSFNSLQDRCRATVVRHLVSTKDTVGRLPVPRLIQNYISELVDAGQAEHSCQPQLTTPVRHLSIVPRRIPRLSLKNWPETGTA